MEAQWRPLQTAQAHPSLCPHLYSCYGINVPNPFVSVLETMPQVTLIFEDGAFGKQTEIKYFMKSETPMVTLVAL